MEKSWMGHVEWAVMFVTILGMHYSINGRLDMAIESMNNRVDATQARFDQFLMSWQQESKDFHGRLCEIEERNRR